jgi:hypothetical protein
MSRFAAAASAGSRVPDCSRAAGAVRRPRRAVDELLQFRHSGCRRTRPVRARRIRPDAQAGDGEIAVRRRQRADAPLTRAAGVPTYRYRCRAVGDEEDPPAVRRPARHAVERSVPRRCARCSRRSPLRPPRRSRRGSSRGRCAGRPLTTAARRRPRVRRQARGRSHRDGRRRCRRAFRSGARTRSARRAATTAGRSRLRVHA